MTEYSTNNDISSIAQDFAVANKYLKKYSTNYAFATKFLTRDSKQDTIIAYSFFRFVDEIIDNPPATSNPEDELKQVKYLWSSLVSSGFTDVSNSGFVYSMYRLCIRRSIPFEYVDSFLSAMMQDAVKTRYATYKELENYMYGSATVVGYIMMYITGYSSHDAFAYARQYAESMQLINFIRDIDEDLRLRNRIYIPQEYMDIFSVTESMLYAGKMNDNIRSMVMFLVDESRKLLNQGRQGICLLNPKIQLPIFLAGNIYEYNLTILKRRNYNIFSPRIRVSYLRKFYIYILSIFKFKKICRKNPVS